MNRTPWQLVGYQDGPAGRGRRHARGDRRARAGDRAAAWHAHPGLLHMYIHLMEMSPAPRAGAAGCGCAARPGSRCRPPDAYADPHRRALRPLQAMSSTATPRHRRRPQVPRARGGGEFLHALPLPRLSLQALRRDVPRPARSRPSRPPTS